MNAAVADLVVILVSIAYAVGGVLLVRRLVRGKIQEGHNDVLAPLFATAGVIYAVLLAFLVIVV